MFQSEIARLRKLGIQGVSDPCTVLSTMALMHYNHNQLTLAAAIPSAQLPLRHLIRPNDVEGAVPFHEFGIAYRCRSLVCPLGHLRAFANFFED